MVDPKYYCETKQKSIKDVVIEIKKEQMTAMSRTINLLQSAMERHGINLKNIDLTEDDIVESVDILMDADDEDVSFHFYLSISIHLF